MMWPVFPHGLGLRDSFPVSFKWFLALKKPFCSELTPHPRPPHPPPSPLLPAQRRSWAFRRTPSQVWWCPALHCLLCHLGGSLFEGEEAATRKPWGTQMWPPHPGDQGWLKCNNGQELLKEQLLHSFPREHSHQMCPLLFLRLLRFL